MEFTNDLFTNNLFKNMEFLKLEDFGRDSLGVLKIDAMNISLDDCGRESLGILHLDKLNTSFQISKDVTSSPLNTAFLYSKSHTKHLLSTSTASGDISFHSTSLNGSEPSKIYSLQSSKLTQYTTDNSILNNACASTGSLLQKFAEVYVKEKVLEENSNIKARTRLLSLPQLPDAAAPTEKFRRCISEGDSEAQNAENVLPLSTQGKFEESVFIEASYLAMKMQDPSFMDNSSDDLFNIDKTAPPKELDLREVTETIAQPVLSVFKTIDKMIPPKTSVTSTAINCAEKSNEQCNPNEVKPCDMPQNLSSDLKNKTPTNSNKIVVNSFTIPRKRQSCGMQTIGTQNIESNENQDKRITRSLSEGHITFSRSINNNNLEEVKNILCNLSNIISNELNEGKSKEEGQNLISNLADILLSDKSSENDSKETLQSSNNSENINQRNITNTIQNECSEVTDLKIKKLENVNLQENLEALDLSVKSKTDTCSKSQHSFGFPHTRLSLPRALKNSSKLQMEKNGNIIKDIKKLKPKKTEIGIKKGPIKAVIPIGNMAKINMVNGDRSKSLSLTPTKSKNSITGSLLNKRTSTPITEQILKPIAQSTPESDSSILHKNSTSEALTQTRKQRHEFQRSPLARPNSLTELSSSLETKKNRSGSAPNLSQPSLKSRAPSTTENQKYLKTRYSASDLKRPNPPNLKRSVSLGKDMKAKPSLLSKMKESMSNSSGTSFLKYGFKSDSKDSKSENCLKERNKILSGVKPTNLIAKLNKKHGKENN